MGGAGNGFLQPTKFSKTLVDTLTAAVELYENTPAVGLHPGPGGGAVVNVAKGRITAARVILALNAFLPRFGCKKHRMLPLTLAVTEPRPLLVIERTCRGHSHSVEIDPKQSSTLRLRLALRAVVARNAFSPFRFPLGLRQLQLLLAMPV